MHSLPIASDLSYEVLERRRGLGQLSTPSLDNVNRRLYRLGSYRQFIADVDEFGDCANPNAPTVAMGEPSVPSLQVREQD